MNACTIVARNFIAQARVLSRSFKEHHPKGKIFVLILDGPGAGFEPLKEAFELVDIHDIGVEPTELKKMQMIYDVLELSTAVKPWLLRSLLESGMTDITYLDPDIQVLAPFEDISELAREHSIVLTPHLMRPLPLDGRKPSEIDIVIAGIYNLGFIAVSRDSYDFLDWWAERLKREGLLEPSIGQHVDQLWVNFAPSYFKHHILRDESINAAYWNLHEREIGFSDGRYTVNGRPLRFFHFSGFDPDAPDLLSKHQGSDPRITLHDRPALARLCKGYAAALIEADYRRLITEPYGFDFLPSGRRIAPEWRRAYREALIGAERRGVEGPPVPFDPRTASDFMHWIKTGASQRTTLKRKVAGLAVRMASGRRITYRVLDRLARTSRDGEGFAARAAGHLYDRIFDTARVAAGGIPRRRRSTGRKPRRPVVEADGRPSGLNVAGYFKAELGVGEAGRLLLEGVKASGLPYSVLTYTETVSRQEHPFDERTPASAVYDTNLVCVNADALPLFADQIGSEFFAGRYTIGLWMWEAEDFPPSLHKAFEWVDEVWTASTFTRNAIARHTTKPVVTVPLPIVVSKPIQLSREELELPEGFMFLFVFDFLSVFERKNPLGIVDVFKRAFGQKTDPFLVIKSINGEMRPHDLEDLREACANQHNIRHIEGYLPSNLKLALMAACDSYVSLHRSEGFGLTMAEAMALGKPTIATNYSGNLEFMDSSNSFLVPCSLVSIPRVWGPYAAGGNWADPDLDSATHLLRHIYEHQDEARSVGLKAARDIQTNWSPKMAADFIRSHYGELQSHRSLTGGR